MNTDNPVPEPTDAIKGLRNQALSISSKDLNISPSIDLPNVYGILMETGYPDALVTLLSMADGTTSLYIGHGGGIIGGGEHENVKQASFKFLKTSEKYLKQFSSTTVFPYPNIGHVKFYILTYNGVLAAEGNENILGEGRHKLSKLFYSGHDVLAELRIIDEQRRKE